MFGILDHTVYSFLDLSGVIYHPLVGNYSFIGQGVGQIRIELDNDMTFHEFNVDGSVIIGRIPLYSGKVTIDCQQSSNIHKWLMSAYQTIKMAESKEWARMSCLIRRVSDGYEDRITGMSFETIPPKVYQAEGQMVSWVLLAGHIKEFVSKNESSYINSLKSMFS
jgi:hypothetical protein